MNTDSTPTEIETFNVWTTVAPFAAEWYEWRDQWRTYRAGRTLTPAKPNPFARLGPNFASDEVLAVVQAGPYAVELSEVTMFLHNRTRHVGVTAVRRGKDPKDHRSRHACLVDSFAELDYVLAALASDTLPEVMAR